MAALRRASADAIAQRSLHLRISPRPANLSESREIHRVLQRFGVVSKYYSNQVRTSPPTSSTTHGHKLNRPRKHVV